MDYFNLSQYLCSFFDLLIFSFKSGSASTRPRSHSSDNITVLAYNAAACSDNRIARQILHWLGGSDPWRVKAFSWNTMGKRVFCHDRWCLAAWIKSPPGGEHLEFLSFFIPQKSPRPRVPQVISYCCPHNNASTTMTKLYFPLHSILLEEGRSHSPRPKFKGRIRQKWMALRTIYLIFAAAGC
jgi:hypothetical protein